MINFSVVDKSWTLFLDRDGVINEDKVGSYIFNKKEFFFTPGAKEAIKTFSNIFGVIVIVTNQRGVGKGLMTQQDLDEIHTYMLDEIKRAGGRIDKIYYCTDTNDDSPNRKPMPGMAWQAKADFPEIDFTKSIMVGNKLSDMQFGKNIDAKTVFIPSTNPETLFPHPLINERVESLFELSKRFPSLIKS